MILFDARDRTEFDHTKFFMENKHPQQPMCLAGTCGGGDAVREVSEDEAREFADVRGVGYFEIREPDDFRRPFKRLAEAFAARTFAARETSLVNRGDAATRIVRGDGSRRRRGRG